MEEIKEQIKNTDKQMKKAWWSKTYEMQQKQF